MAAAERKKSVRAASREDSWRAFTKKNFKTQLDEISYRNLMCLQDDTLVFRGGITAIIGGNGSGKSTIAAAVAELLGGEQYTPPPEVALRTGGSALTAVVKFEGVSKTFRVSSVDGQRRRTGPDDEGERYAGLDAALGIQSVKKGVSDPNFNDNLEGLQASTLNQDEVKMLSFLIGKEYEAASFYEVSDYVGSETFPFFTLKASKHSYNNHTMGQGELALCIVWWFLKRAQSHSVLILEEPESHLSPRSQRALLDLLARVAVEKDLAIVITTHSPTMVRSLSSDRIIFVSHQAGKSITTRNASRGEIESILGEGLRRTAGILVEDAGALALVRAGIKEFFPAADWWLGVEIGGSAGDLEQIMMRLPKNVSWLSVAAIFDGDQRENVKWSDALFLPGNEDPDEQCKQLLGDKTFQRRFARFLHITPGKLELALAHAAGTDYHDWPVTIAGFLNLEVQVIRSAMSRTWLSVAKNANALNDLLKKVITSFRIHDPDLPQGV